MGRPTERTARTGRPGPAAGAAYRKPDRSESPVVAAPSPGEVSVTVSTHPGADTRARWDQLVTTTAHADVAQLSAWAEFRRQAGFTPLFVLAHRADRLVGGALVLQRRLPGLGGLGYLPYGPLLADSGDDPTAAAICRALAHMPRPSRQQVLFVQLPRGTESIGQRFSQLGFRPSAAGIAPVASLELDLSPAAEQLHKHLSSGTRGSIRRAAARGITVRMGTDQDLPVVSGLLDETAAHHGFPPLPLTYLRTMYRQLGPQEHIAIGLAERDGVALAAQVLTVCCGLAKLRLTGMHRSEATPTGAAALLQWETILWAKANGFDRFDFGGISASSVDAIRAGRAGLASRVNGRDYFKASFGGRPYHYPQPLERFSSPAVRIGYDLAHRSGVGRRIIRRAKNLMRTGRTVAAPRRSAPS